MVELFTKTGRFNYRQPSIAIETGTDRNEIDRVKHRKAGADRVENDPVVYKKVGKIDNIG